MPINCFLSDLEDGHGLSYLDPGDLSDLGDPERPPLREGLLDFRSGRTYGVELEVSRLSRLEAADVLTAWRRDVGGKQSKNWTAKHDGSIPYGDREFVGPPSRSINSLVALAPLMELIDHYGGECLQNSDLSEEQERCCYCSGECDCYYCSENCDCEVCSGRYECDFCRGHCDCDGCELNRLMHRHRRDINYYKTFSTELRDGIDPDTLTPEEFREWCGARCLLGSRRAGYQMALGAIAPMVGNADLLFSILAPCFRFSYTSHEFMTGIRAIFRVLRERVDTLSAIEEHNEIHTDDYSYSSSVAICLGSCSCEDATCEGECAGRCTCASSALDQGSCGLHVHVEARDCSRAQRAAVGIVYHQYHELYCRWHHPDRCYSGWAERRYCTIWSLQDMELDSMDRIYKHFHDTRFRSINLCSYEKIRSDGTKLGTIECRQAAATLDPAWIASWVQIYRAVVDTVQRWTWIDDTTTVAEIRAHCPRDLRDLLRPVLPHVDECYRYLDSTRGGLDDVCPPLVNSHELRAQYAYCGSLTRNLHSTLDPYQAAGRVYSDLTIENSVRDRIAHDPGVLDRISPLPRRSTREQRLEHYYLMCWRERQHIIRSLIRTLPVSELEHWQGTGCYPCDLVSSLRGAEIYTCRLSNHVLCLLERDRALVESMIGAPA